MITKVDDAQTLRWLRRPPIFGEDVRNKTEFVMGTRPAKLAIRDNRDAGKTKGLSILW